MIRSLKLTAYRAAAALLPRVPRRTGLQVAAGLGSLTAYAALGPRRVVESNLRRVLGPVPTAQIRATARGVFRQTAKNYFDFFRLPRLSLAEVEHLVQVQGEATFWDVYRAGRGIVLLTAHLGTVDAAAQVFAARRVEVLILVEPIDPPKLLDLVAGIRRSHGIQIEVARAAGVRRAIGFLRQGGVVVIVGDQPIQGHGEWISFFGEPARLPVGAVELAVRTGADLLPAYSIRNPDDSFTVFVDPPLTLARTGDRKQLTTQNLQLARDNLEKFIRAYPDQWVVFRPVWPVAPKPHLVAVPRSSHG